MQSTENSANGKSSSIKEGKEEKPPMNKVISAFIEDFKEIMNAAPIRCGFCNKLTEAKDPTGSGKEEKNPAFVYLKLCLQRGITYNCGICRKQLGRINVDFQEAKTFYFLLNSLISFLRGENLEKMLGSQEFKVSMLPYDKKELLEELFKQIRIPITKYLMDVMKDTTFKSGTKLQYHWEELNSEKPGLAICSILDEKRKILKYFIIRNKHSFNLSLGNTSPTKTLTTEKATDYNVSCIRAELNRILKRISLMYGNDVKEEEFVFYFYESVFKNLIFSLGKGNKLALLTYIIKNYPYKENDLQNTQQYEMPTCYLSE